MKKLLLCSFLPLCAYASEGYEQKQNMKKRCGGEIIPSVFNDYGKDVLQGYISVWINATKEGNIPQDKGLAKIFADMQRDGIDAIIKDEKALKKANEFLTDYRASPSKIIEDTIKDHLNRGEGGNYYFSGTEEFNIDLLRVIRQHEFINILYKRHEAPIMPSSKLLYWYYDQTTASALEILKLNVDNTKLSADAIRGVALVIACKYQNDNKSNI